MGRCANSVWLETLAMTSHHIELICFDIGNVLIELSSGWHQACAEADVLFPDTADNIAIIDHLDALNREHECGRIDADSFDAQAAQITGLAPHQIDAVCRAWVRAPFPGVVEFLARVAESDTTTACLSNTNDRHWNMFHGQEPNRSELPMHLLDHPMASHHIGVIKPDNRIFSHAEQATAVPAERILFFDDNGENCTAAEQRGWCVRKIDPSCNPVTQMQATLEEVGIMRKTKQ